MEISKHEPKLPGNAPHPCSTPHSEPVHWLRSESADQEPPKPPLAPETLDGLAVHLQRDPDALAEFVERLSPEQERKDGWSPFLRKLFLQVVAETGLVTLACRYTGMSRQSAYALATRDPLFAAGWDAAVLLARGPLADQLFEQSVEGITDTIVKNGEVVAERRRFDSRLSIAVLNRLDKRCDRAEERGSAHLNVMRNWDEWLRLTGTGDDSAARALLESAPFDDAKQRQPCQLPQSANPTAEIPSPPGYDPSDNCWKNDDGTWMTTWLPPEGFEGRESRTWNGWDYYERECTAEEAALLEADETRGLAEEEAELRADAIAERDRFFEALRRHAGPDPAPACTSTTGNGG